MASPKLRFKAFESDLISLPFEKYIESSKYGPRFDANDYDENGNVKTIRGTDVALDATIKYEQVPKANLPIKMVEEHQLKSGDILMITTADCGLSAVFEEQDIPFIASAYAVRISLKNSISPLWTKYYLQTQHIVNEVNKYVRKGTLSNLPLSDISKFTFTVPSKEEQTKIASFLSAVDEKIAQLTQKHELLSQYKQGMMQKLFSQQIRFKADDGSEFGEWKENKFGECINVFDNLRKPISASERIAGNTPYYGANGIQSYIDGYTHDGEFILIAEDGANDLINYPIQYVNGKIWVNNHAHVVSGHHEKIQNKFLKYRLKSIDFTKYLVGGGRAKLNAGAMKEISFSAPCLEEQTKIADFLSSIDQKIDVVSEQLEQAKLWKKGLLQQMFV